MSLLTTVPWGGLGCAPRASGDEPKWQAFDSLELECSPRERG